MITTLTLFSTIGTFLISFMVGLSIDIDGLKNSVAIHV